MGTNFPAEAGGGDLLWKMIGSALMHTDLAPVHHWPPSPIAQVSQFTSWMSCGEETKD